MPPKKQDKKKVVEEPPPVISDEFPESVLLPEWNDAEIAEERWGIDPETPAKGQPPHPEHFVDPDGELVLPPELQSKVYEWKTFGAEVVVDEETETESNLPVVLATKVEGQQRPGVTHCFKGLKSSPWDWLVSHFLMLGDYKNSIEEGYFLHELIYPKGEDGLPSYNPYGKYVVKVFVFGQWRKLIIDDRIPFDDEGESLFFESQNQPERELWPIILTKAWLKLNAANPHCLQREDFSSVLSLLGWAPQKMALLPLSSWSLLGSIITDEQVMASVGTGMDLSVEECSKLTEMGLVPGHPYQACEIREAGGMKIIRLKSLWGRWKGRFSDFDEAMWTPDVQEEMGCSRVHRKQTYTQFFDFWMPFKDCLRLFRDIYVYRSPAKFKGTHTYVEPKLKAGYVSMPPVFSLELEYPTEMVVCMELDPGKLPPAEADAPPPAVRGDARLSIERFSWTDPSSASASVRLDVSSVNSQRFSVPAGTTSYRLRFEGDAYIGYALSFFLVDKQVSAAVQSEEDYLSGEAVNVCIQETDDVYNVLPPLVWTYWCRQVLRLEEPTFLAVALHVKDTSILPYLRFQITDNDTYDSEEYIFFRSPAKLMLPNKNGYTISVTSYAPVEFPPGRYKIRVYCATMVVPLTKLPCTVVHNFEKEYEDNRHQILCRYKVVPTEKIESTARIDFCAKIEFNKRDPPIQVRFLDNGETIHEEKFRRMTMLQQRLLPDPPAPATDRSEGADAPEPTPPHDYILEMKVLLRRNGPVCVKNPLSEEDAALLEGLKWTMIINSTAEFELTPDTTWDDTYAAIKGEWFEPQPGRLEKARKTRTMFLTEVNGAPPTEEPVSATPATVSRGKSGAKSGGSMLEMEEVIEKPDPAPPVIISGGRQSLRTEEELASNAEVRDNLLKDALAQIEERAEIRKGVEEVRKEYIAGMIADDKQQVADHLEERKPLAEKRMAYRQARQDDIKAMNEAAEQLKAQEQAFSDLKAGIKPKGKK